MDHRPRSHSLTSHDPCVLWELGLHLAHSSWLLQVSESLKLYYNCENEIFTGFEVEYTSVFSTVKTLLINNLVVELKNLEEYTEY